MGNRFPKAIVILFLSDSLKLIIKQYKNCIFSRTNELQVMTYEYCLIWAIKLHRFPNAMMISLIPYSHVLEGLAGDGLFTVEGPQSA